MVDEKLTDKEKEEMQQAFKDAVLSESDIRIFATGEDTDGETVEPVESSEDMITAAATALEFVDGLAAPEHRADAISDESAVAGFDALLKKLETLRSDISALQRGVVGVFAAQLLAFRGKVVDLKSRISEEMVAKLRMQFFKTFIEATFVDIVDQEFAALEKDLVDKIVEQTQQKFKEFATKVRESEGDLRATIVEQQDIVRSFMQSLEEDATSSVSVLSEKEAEISKLETKIKNLQSQVDSTKGAGVETDELNRRIIDLESEISAVREDLFKKDARLETRTKERDEALSEVDEMKITIAESKSELAIYKEQVASVKPEKSAASEAEIKTLQSKIELLETAVSEKRAVVDTYVAEIRDLGIKLDDTEKDKIAAEAIASKHSKELDSIHEKLSEVTNLEAKVYDLEQSLQDAEKKVGILEMQKEAFEKATRLMERERDTALDVRDLANERTKRYITVLGIEANTKVLLLVDEVGSMSFADLGKALAIPVGLATKHARQLEKLEVLKIKGDKAYSTLQDLDIEEGEVKLD
ncbi:MAG: hypothetical protein ACTSV2_15990 [Candidatus Thorarchaeota archaeon]